MQSAGGHTFFSMNVKSWFLFVLTWVALSGVLSSPVFGSDRIEYGHDEQGRRTETQHGGGWGDTIITYDPETGLEIYRKWLSPEGRLWSETFTNLDTGEVRRVSYMDFSRGEFKRSEEIRTDPNIVDVVRRIKFDREEAANQKNDNWDFLPGYTPGMILEQEKDEGPSPKQNEEAVPMDSELPLIDPPTLIPESNPPEPSQEDSVPSLPFDSFGGVNEEVPAEIDYSKYGDQQVMDGRSGRVSVIDTKTGTVTDFQNFDGETHATMRMNGNVVQTDVYNQQGKLISSKVLNPITQKWEDRTVRPETNAPLPQKTIPNKVSSAFDRADALKNPMSGLFPSNLATPAGLDAPILAPRDMGEETGMFPKASVQNEHHDSD